VTHPKAATHEAFFPTPCGPRRDAPLDDLDVLGGESKSGLQSFLGQGERPGGDGQDAGIFAVQGRQILG